MAPWYISASPAYGQNETPSFAFGGPDWLAQRSRTFLAFPACAVAAEIIRIKQRVRSSGLLHGSSVRGLGLAILELAPHSGVLGISCRILFPSLARRLGLLRIRATHPCLAKGASYLRLNHLSLPRLSTVSHDGSALRQRQLPIS